MKGNLLFYFEKRTDKDPIGAIILEGCTIEMAESETGADQYCFKIIFHGPHNRTYFLSAESQEIMERYDIVALELHFYYLFPQFIFLLLNIFLYSLSFINIIKQLDEGINMRWV